MYALITVQSSTDSHALLPIRKSIPPTRFLSYLMRTICNFLLMKYLCFPYLYDTFTIKSNLYKTRLFPS